MVFDLKDIRRLSLQTTVRITGPEGTYLGFQRSGF